MSLEGVIYKLTNVDTGLVYIGQTNNFVKRMADHQRMAAGNSKLPLYRAIRKYGWENFRITIIGCAETRDALNELEIAAIAAYSSSTRDHGYNISSGGGGVSGYTKDHPDFWGIRDPERFKTRNEKLSAKLKGTHRPKGDESPNASPTRFGGVDFPCVKAALAHFGISKNAYYSHLNQYGPDHPFSGVKKPGSQPIVLDGASYDSVASAMEQLGVSRGTIVWRIRSGRGYYLFKTVKPLPARVDGNANRRKPVTFDGVSFASIENAASVLGVTRQTIKNRLRRSGKAD